MVARLDAKGAPRGRVITFALLLGALLALAVPALASAATFKVNGTGDLTTTAACEAETGECTLRGAVAAANAGPSLDEITFTTPAGTLISLGSTLSISQPVRIIGAVTEVSGKPVPDVKVQVGSSAFSISAPETVIEGLGIEAGSRGVVILGGQGAVIRDNFISGVTGTLPQAGVEISPGNGNVGNLIEGNQITVPGNYSWGVAIQYGANEIFGNEIEAPDKGGAFDGCCYQGIYVTGEGAGNQIGGDTPKSENVITNFWYGAIWINTGNHNEIGRNRGISTNSGFISAPGAIEAPAIAKAYPTAVSGTAKPEAKVRVFATADEGTGHIEGFLGERVADESGAWSIAIPTTAVGSHVTATQTLEGSTSEMAATRVIESEPSGGGETGGGETGGGGGGGGGEGSGGSGGGGATTTTATAPSTSPVPLAAPAPTKPTVTITRGPKKSSSATKATFKFTASPAPGVKFECKLDGKKWASCRSPKTYKKLKPGKHTFRVRATASALTGAAARFGFSVKP